MTNFTELSEKQQFKIALYTKELMAKENRHLSVGEITDKFYKKYPAFDKSSIGDITDAFGDVVNDGDFLNVQDGQICQVKEIGNELYFAPYGKIELVRSYFRQDYFKHPKK
jgi:hypothetical protein